MAKKIDTKFLNPFFSAAYDVITEMSGEEVSRGQLSVSKSQACESLGFSVVIGVTGEVEGRVIVDMTQETAIKFAEIMNMEDIGEFNELVKSSMGEIGNMVSGRAVSRLQDEGYEFRITPPTLFEGQEMKVTTPLTLPVIIVPLKISFGEILVNLALTQNTTE